MKVSLKLISFLLLVLLVSWLSTSVCFSITLKGIGTSPGPRLSSFDQTTTREAYSKK